RHFGEGFRIGYTEGSLRASVRAVLHHEREYRAWALYGEIGSGSSPRSDHLGDELQRLGLSSNSSRRVAIIRRGAPGETSRVSPKTESQRTPIHLSIQHSLRLKILFDDIELDPLSRDAFFLFCEFVGDDDLKRILSRLQLRAEHQATVNDQTLEIVLIVCVER